MPFVNQHSPILTTRNITAGDSVYYSPDHAIQPIAGFALCRHVEAFEHFAAPVMEVVHVDLVCDPLFMHQRFQLCRQRDVVAEDENWLAQDLSQVQAAVAEYHSLPRSRYAVDYSVPIAQAARESLLLVVHYLDQIWHRDIGVVILRMLVEQTLLLWIDANLRKQVPANSIDLRKCQRPRKLHVEHIP